MITPTSTEYTVANENGRAIILRVQYPDNYVTIRPLTNERFWFCQSKPETVLEVVNLMKEAVEFVLSGGESKPIWHNGGVQKLDSTSYPAFVEAT